MDYNDFHTKICKNDVLVEASHASEKFSLESFNRNIKPAEPGKLDFDFFLKKVTRRFWNLRKISNFAHGSECEIFQSNSPYKETFMEELKPVVTKECEFD